MKIKFLSAKYGYKAGDIVEIDQSEAADFVAKGFAEEVKAEDVMEKALSDLEVKIGEKVEAAITDATAKIAEKVSKGVARPRLVVGQDNIESDPQGGFKSFGEFAQQVVKFSQGKDVSDNMKRYVKSTTGNTTAAAPDAGPTVPVAYMNQILRPADITPGLYDRTFQIPVATNTVKVPVMKRYNRANTTPANGIVALPTGEAQPIVQSRTNWEQVSMSLGKLAVLVPVSDELLEDNAVSLDTILTRESTNQIYSQLNKGVVSGMNGVMTGIIGHGSVKTVARSDVGEINFNDVLKMYASFAHDDSDYNNAVWIGHPTIITQLANLSSGSTNVYTAPGGAQNLPSSQLLGRPYIPTGASSALGTAGDLMLVDLSKYFTIHKGDINAAQSIHLFFNTDETAFRYTLRVAGKPAYSSPFTLEDGVTTVSPFVVLGDHV